MRDELDDAALELLELAAIVVSDSLLWTRHARAAMRWKRVNAKPIIWVDPLAPEVTVEERALAQWRFVSCSPRDHRARMWTVLGALEFVAEDPDGPDVVRALDMLIAAARGWTISRVEEHGREWALWTIAVALTHGVTLAPRDESSPVVPFPTRLEVDLKTVEEAPPTARSSEIRRGRRSARAA